MMGALFREITVFLHSTKLWQQFHHVHCYVRKNSSRNFEKLTLKLEPDNLQVATRIANQISKRFLKNIGRYPGRRTRYLSFFLVNYRPTKHNLQRYEFLKF